MAKLDDYLTIQECADELGCTYSTVWRWIEAGHIPEPIKKFGKSLINRKHCKRPEGIGAQGANLFGKKKGGKA